MQCHAPKGQDTRTRKVLPRAANEQRGLLVMEQAHLGTAIVTETAMYPSRATGTVGARAPQSRHGQTTSRTRVQQSRHGPALKRVMAPRSRHGQAISHRNQGLLSLSAGVGTTIRARLPSLPVLGGPEFPSAPTTPPGIPGEARRGHLQRGPSRLRPPRPSWRSRSTSRRRAALRRALGRSTRTLRQTGHGSTTARREASFSKMPRRPAAGRSTEANLGRGGTMRIRRSGSLRRHQTRIRKRACARAGTAAWQTTRMI